MQGKLLSGNFDIGLGTKKLDGTDVFYARARNGARLYYRMSGNTITVVGKSGKGKGQQTVINELLKLYKQ